VYQYMVAVRARHSIVLLRTSTTRLRTDEACAAQEGQPSPAHARHSLSIHPSPRAQGYTVALEKERRKNAASRGGVDQRPLSDDDLKL
jgi:hypothetical protein